MGSGKGGSIQQAQPLGRYAGSRWRYRCSAFRANSVRVAVGHANSTGKCLRMELSCALVRFSAGSNRINLVFSFTQGGHIKIHLHSDIPVQVDGEPWVQSPGDVVVLKSALKVSATQFTYLTRNK